MQSDAIADAVPDVAGADTRPHILADAQSHVLPIPRADDAGPDILAPSADVRLRDRRSMCWRADALADARANSGPEPCAFSAAHGRSHSANAVTDARPEPCALRARGGAGRDAPAINDAPIWSSFGAADLSTHCDALIITEPRSDTRSAEVWLRDRRAMCWRADALTYTDARANSGPEPCAFSAAHGRSHSANAVTDARPDARPEPCALRARDGAGLDAPAINDAPIWSSVGAADLATHSAMRWRADAATLVGRCHQPVFTITIGRPHYSAEHSALFFADLGAIGSPNPLADDSIVC